MATKLYKDAEKALKEAKELYYKPDDIMSYLKAKGYSEQILSVVEIWVKRHS